MFFRTYSSLTLLSSHLNVTYRGAESETPYAEAFYSNVTFMQSFYNSLSDDGVLVLQLGESPEAWAAGELLSGDKNRVAALSLLETVGFESIHVFEEVSSDLLESHVRCLSDGQS